MKTFLLDSSLVYYASIDMQGNYMEVNQAFCNAFGMDSPQDWKGLSYLPTVHPDDVEICVQAARECFEKKGAKVSFCIRKPKKKGGYWYTRWEMEGLRDEEGNFIGLHGIGVDETAAYAYHYIRSHQFKLLDLAGDIVSFTDNDNHPLYVNAAIEKVLGYTAVEVLENFASFIGRIQPESLDTYAQANTPDEQGNWPEGFFEIKWRHKNGHTVIIEHHVVNVFNEQRELIGRVSVGRDITNLRKYQEDAGLYQSLFEAILQYSPLIGMVVNKEGTVMASNPIAEQTFGQSPTGKSLSDLMPAHTAQKLLTRVQEVFSTLQSHRDEEFYQLHSGEAYWEIILFPVCWSNGIYDGVILLASDKTTNFYARRQLELLSLVARYTTNYVVITDAKGYTVWVNETFCEKTGYLPADIIGKKPGHLLQGPETDKETLRRISQAIAQGKGFVEEILNYTRSGEKYWTKIYCSPVYDESGQLVNFAAIQTDTTREKYQLKTLRESLQQIRILRKALERSSMVAILDSELQIIYCNLEFASAFGQTREGMHMLKFDPFSQMLYNPLKMVNKGYPWRGEVEYQLPNRKIWFDLTISPIVENKKLTGQYLVVAKNITQRKEALELVRLRNESIKAELEKQVALRTYELEVEKNKLIETHKRITGSIFYAKRIQRAIFPLESEIREHFADFFVFDLPKDVVSGDFYWFGHINGKSIIALIDCTGHGIPGALLTILAYSILNEIILHQQITNPLEIITVLDERIQNSLKQKTTDVQDGMDLAVCVVDKAAGTLDFAGAKSDLVYVEEGTVHVVRGSRMLVGGVFKPRDMSYEPARIALKAGQVFYLSSDGYKDQIGGPHKRRFGSERLYSLFGQIYKKPFVEQRDILDQTLVSWLLNFPLRFDDIMVLGFRVF